MSLTKQDLTGIRNLFLDAFEVTVNPRLEAIEARLDRLESELASFKSETNQRLAALETQFQNFEGRLEAVENDIKELYRMIKQSPFVNLASKSYQKLSNEQKIHILDREVTNLAQNMGVKLSR